MTPDTHVMQMLSLEGKVAVLSGGAGKYGRQIAAALAEAGARTTIASRNVEALETVAAAHRALGHRMTAMPLDQGDEASILRLRDAIMEREGQIDVLVNNAVARVTTGGWESDAAEFDASMHINATGLFMMTRAFGEAMIPRRRGSIVNIGSMMGMVGVENHNYDGTDMRPFGAGDYFFHKGGMINFTRYCASYFGVHNIRVNCVSPGGFHTPDQPERFVRQYSERTQLNRMANDTDLKGIIVLLASDASAYITGANLPVDGGYTAK